MDYTQEQLDELIKAEVAKATDGLFTQDELNRQVTKEVDRRVESGIQKGLETHRKKMRKEIEDELNMSAQEKADKKLQEALADIASREATIKKQENLLNAKSILTEKNIPKDKYEKVLGTLVTEDEESTLSNVNNFVDVFESIQKDLKTKLQAEMANIDPPELGERGGEQAVTKEKFNEMTYSEKLAFKAEKPEQYQSFMKS